MTASDVRRAATHLCKHVLLCNVPRRGVRKTRPGKIGKERGVGAVNKVILVGNLGRDPEVRYTPGGQPVASFSIATSESWNDKQGQRQEKTEWHRIVVWGKLAELSGEYLAKGRQVFLEGRLQTREWNDRDGNKRTTTEVIANNIVFLGRGGEGGGGGGGGSRRGGSESGGGASAGGSGTHGGGGSSGNDDGGGESSGGGSGGGGGGGGGGSYGGGSSRGSGAGGGGGGGSGGGENFDYGPPPSDDDVPF